MRPDFLIICKGGSFGYWCEFSSRSRIWLPGGVVHRLLQVPVTELMRCLDPTGLSMFAPELDIKQLRGLYMEVRWRLCD
jgi:hypothetical protein